MRHLDISLCFGFSCHQICYSYFNYEKRKICFLNWTFAQNNYTRRSQKKVNTQIYRKCNQTYVWRFHYFTGRSPSAPERLKIHIFKYWLAFAGLKYNRLKRTPWKNIWEIKNLYHDQGSKSGILLFFWYFLYTLDSKRFYKFWIFTCKR